MYGRERSPKVHKKNENPSKVVGVFGMDWQTDDRYLEEKFSKFGRIEKCVVVWNHSARRSRGYGFVTFEDVESATDAVETMNGKMFDGREIRVDYSFTKEGHNNRRDRSRSRERRRSRSRSPRRRRSRSRDRRRSRSR